MELFHRRQGRMKLSPMGKFPMSKCTDVFDVTVVAKINEWFDIRIESSRKWQVFPSILRSVKLNCHILQKKYGRSGSLLQVWQILHHFPSFCCTPLGKRQNWSHLCKISLIFNVDLCKKNLLISVCRKLWRLI